MNLNAMLERDEGRVPHAYRDSEGYLTIGVGHLIDERKGGKLPDFIIDLLLEHDIETKTAELVRALPWVANLSEPRKAVLISMAFQLGVPGLLKFRRALTFAELGQWMMAAEHFLDSKVAREQSPARWQRHADQLRTGRWQ